MEKMPPKNKNQKQKEKGQKSLLFYDYDIPGSLSAPKSLALPAASILNIIPFTGCGFTFNHSIDIAGFLNELPPVSPKNHLLPLEMPKVPSSLPGPGP